MRIWSVHPSYLDAKGLVALWRETLLAKHVLDGKTKGYKHHPQLLRFKQTDSPVCSIHCYLKEIYTEAKSRGYKFDKTKIDWNCSAKPLTVTDKQLGYEMLHLLKKLEMRDPETYLKFQSIKLPKPHPMFEVIDGEIEPWEVL